VCNKNKVFRDSECSDLLDTKIVRQQNPHCDCDILGKKNNAKDTHKNSSFEEYEAASNGSEEGKKTSEDGVKYLRMPIQGNSHSKSNQTSQEQLLHNKISIVTVGTAPSTMSSFIGGYQAGRFHFSTPKNTSSSHRVSLPPKEVNRALTPGPRKATTFFVEPPPKISEHGSRAGIVKTHRRSQPCVTLMNRGGSRTPPFALRALIASMGQPPDPAPSSPHGLPPTIASTTAVTKFVKKLKKTEPLQSKLHNRGDYLHNDTEMAARSFGTSVKVAITSKFGSLKRRSKKENSLSNSSTSRSFRTLARSFSSESISGKRSWIGWIMGGRNADPTRELNRDTAISISDKPKDKVKGARPKACQEMEQQAQKEKLNDEHKLIDSFYRKDSFRQKSVILYFENSSNLQYTYYVGVF